MRRPPGPRPRPGRAPTVLAIARATSSPWSPIADVRVAAVDDDRPQARNVRRARHVDRRGHERVAREERRGGGVVGVAGEHADIRAARGLDARTRRPRPGTRPAAVAGSSSRTPGGASTQRERKKITGFAHLKSCASRLRRSPEEIPFAGLTAGPPPRPGPASGSGSAPPGRRRPSRGCRSPRTRAAGRRARS